LCIDAYARSTRGTIDVPADEPFEGSAISRRELRLPPKRFNIVSLLHQALRAWKVQPFET
jgi:hypothetical protein